MGSLELCHLKSSPFQLCCSKVLTMAREDDSQRAPCSFLVGCKGWLTAIKSLGSVLVLTFWSSPDVSRHSFVCSSVCVCVYACPCAYVCAHQCMHPWNLTCTWISRCRGVTSHLHWLPEGAAVRQAVFVEGTQVTSTPVVNDIALSGTPVWAHCGAL